jgi:hypothetical protein
MIFRQLFDSSSGTYTYLLASRRGGEALIIDPALERVERYLQLVQAAQDAGLKTACHIEGGVNAWKKANGPLAR